MSVWDSYTIAHSPSPTAPLYTPVPTTLRQRSHYGENDSSVVLLSPFASHTTHYNRLALAWDKCDINIAMTMAANVNVPINRRNHVWQSAKKTALWLVNETNKTSHSINDGEAEGNVCDIRDYRRNVPSDVQLFHWWRRSLIKAQMLIPLLNEVTVRLTMWNKMCQRKQNPTLHLHKCNLLVWCSHYQT